MAEEQLVPLLSVQDIQSPNVRRETIRNVLVAVLAIVLFVLPVVLDTFYIMKFLGGFAVAFPWDFHPFFQTLGVFAFCGLGNSYILRILFRSVLFSIEIDKLLQKEVVAYHHTTSICGLCYIGNCCNFCF